MNKHNKKMILAVVSILIIVLLVPLSYAAYTSVTSARRVVSTANAADFLFSSNYLSVLSKSEMGNSNARSENKYKNIPVSYQSSNTTQAVYISVCNYAQGYLAKWSDKDINYHIEFSLVNLENHEEISANTTYTDKSGKTVSGADILKKEFKVSEGIATTGSNTISHTYTGKSLKYSVSAVSQDMYTIFFDTTYADIVGVKVEVITESNSPAYSDYGLGGVLCLSSYETAASVGWNGEVQEADTESKKKSSEYTGFNYEVFGSGAGTVTVTWDDSMFDISDIFLKDMNISKTGNSISFKVGGDNQNDRFFIQFYRIKQPQSDENWNTINKAFTCTFEEDKTE